MCDTHGSVFFFAEVVFYCNMFTSTKLSLFLGLLEKRASPSLALVISASIAC